MSRFGKDKKKNVMSEQSETLFKIKNAKKLINRSPEALSFLLKTSQRPDLKDDQHQRNRSE